MAAKKRYVGRSARRYKFKDEETYMIRFTNAKHKRIFATRIFDISESGVSFATAHRYVPKIGEIIKMDFAPLGSVRMACKGKVVRIEEPNSGSSWAKFPDTVKVGVAFYEMQLPYRKALQKSLHLAFRRDGVTAEDVFYVISNASGRGSFEFRDSWFYKNALSLIATFVIFTAVGWGAYFLLQNADSRKPATEATWASGFFEKVRDNK